jgi:hypothetical protein
MSPTRIGEIVSNEDMIWDRPVGIFLLNSGNVLQKIRRLARIINYILLPSGIPLLGSGRYATPIGGGESKLAPSLNRDPSEFRR